MPALAPCNMKLIGISQPVPITSDRVSEMLSLLPPLVKEVLISNRPTKMFVRAKRSVLIGNCTR